MPQLRSEAFFHIALSVAGLYISVAGLYTLRVHSFSSHSHTTTKSVAVSMTPSQWTPLVRESFPTLTRDGSRIAKDEEYLDAVLGSWNKAQGVETSKWIYHDEEEDNTPLYGHLVRPIDQQQERRPGVLLFHTAAGPQDVFLFQKAVTLASSIGCVVLICDVLSDPDGWAWDSDRTRFQEVKDKLLRNDAKLLQSRVSAAIKSALNDDLVDPKRLAALGWCFGAQPILELATLQDDPLCSVSTLVSYHGVYRRENGDANSPPPSRTNTNTPSEQRDVLICTGTSDPFVSPEDLVFAQTFLEAKGYRVTTMAFDGAKHGFTNPAQDFNTNPAFAYSERAAKESWEATMALLRRKLLLE